MLHRSLFFALFLLCGSAAVWSAPAHAAEASQSAYDKWTAGATAQHGLLTVWNKNGKVFIEVRADQLDADFIETIVPGNGLGGNFIVWGNTDHLPAMLVRFHRAGDKVALVWPNTNFVAKTPELQDAIARNFPQSVVGVGDIAATDPKTGAVIFDASSLLRDILDLNNIFKGSLNSQASYKLDPERTYFGQTKAFPRNILIEADQTWSTEAAHVADVAPDARSLQMRIVYNFAQPPGSSDYRPRYADDRIGLYDAVYLQFNSDNDQARERQLRYLIRLNIQPSDPSKAISPAKRPVVYYLSNSIPPQYRAAVRDGILGWNKAFLAIGISGAIEVQDQPNDPNWDPEDIRYNVIRWVTEAQPSFGADSQTLYDPRTGEEFRSGVLVSAGIPIGAARTWKTFVDPVRYGRDSDPMPASFLHDAFVSTLLHETGHNLGMQHNFIGSTAYTAAELQNPAFTSKYGITSTVMEYAPTNLWPKSFRQGAYNQSVLGPYDYFTVKYGYAPLAGASTPQAELPTLRRWASAWSNPKYRYASDEDVSWANGHASDPRVNTGDLTNDPLGWCGVQLRMDHDLMQSANRRLPKTGNAYEDLTAAFAVILRSYTSCATLPAHFIGGQYISRAHRGDPGARAPVVPVSRDTEKRAFAMLDRYLFSANAWQFSPQLLQGLGYSEWAGYGYVSWTGYGNLPAWAYNPPERHDYPITENIALAQKRAIEQLLNPLVLQRIDENPGEAVQPTMTISDLFSWLQQSIYGDIGSRTHSIPLIKRNLQMLYARELLTLITSPPSGTPSDAQALARLELTNLRQGIGTTLRSGGFDEITRAHLENLRQRASSKSP
ncbi:MAG: zinc-dependent metalloprotease [Candidatus Eremiobacteraeota bacterium]|nr:zinc-dependent metalloprotease [Candidatus Eremiobacteraeota bacterium]